MKYLVFTLSLLLLTVSAQAQNYEKAMLKGLEKIVAAESSEDMVSAANMFERIGTTEESEWLPPYYETLCRTLAAFMAEDSETKAGLIDAAGKSLELARDRGGDASELGVLEGRLYQAMMDADPGSMMTNGPKSSAVLQGAFATNPDNPRAALVLGENTMYTPEQYGGGMENACPLIGKALKLFGEQELESEISPSWGQERAIELWKKCQGE